MVTCKLVIRKKLVNNQNSNKKVVFIVVILSLTTVDNYTRGCLVCWGWSGCRGCRGSRGFVEVVRVYNVVSVVGCRGCRDFQGALGCRGCWGCSRGCSVCLGGPGCQSWLAFFLIISGSIYTGRIIKDSSLNYTSEIY